MICKFTIIQTSFVRQINPTIKCWYSFILDTFIQRRQILFFPFHFTLECIIAVIEYSMK